MSGAALARVPLFADLPAADLERLGACLRPRRYPKGAVVFLQGDPGASLCIVEEGRVKLALSSPEGKEAVLALMGPGDVFGELALLDGQPRSADAVASETSRLLLLERGAFLQQLEASPRLAITLLGVLSRRLRRDAELVQDAAFLDVPARLARVLLRLAEPPDHPGDVALVVPGRMTQAELAGLVGATRESVNKWLGSYERRGLIGRQGGRISILRPEELHKRAR